MTDAPKPLNEKQQRFVREYLVDLNGAQAAIRTGYAPNSAHVTASRLLSDANIAAAVQEAMDKRSEKTEIDAAFVLEGIKRVTLRCEQAEPVLDKEGNPTGEYTFQAGAALKGYELMGKHLKLFTEKVEHSGVIEQLTDQQIDARIAALYAQGSDDGSA